MGTVIAAAVSEREGKKITEMTVWGESVRGRKVEMRPWAQIIRGRGKTKKHPNPLNSSDTSGEHFPKQPLT